jgi:hypothetical protein
VRRPLAGLRIIATVPPYTWFGGVDFNFAVEMVGELRDLGATVLELDTGGFVTGNELYIERAIAASRSFQPDVAISLPNAGYALLCNTATRENLFHDILQIPAIMLWDHGLLQFPKLLLAPLPKNPAEATSGSLARIRRMLDRPLYHHYSPDKGHIAVMDKLGIIDSSKVHLFLQPAYPNFVRHGSQNPATNAYRTRVAFAGNVYLRASQNLPFRNQPVLTGIEARMLNSKKSRLTMCLWDLLMVEIAALDQSTRSRFRLEPDSTFFWSFIHDEIAIVGNTEARLSVLAGLKHECDFFGNFLEPESVPTLRDAYQMTFRKNLDYFTELPLLFMNTDVVVDVVNLGYNTGVSPKIMGCLACGGLVLFDYKNDFGDSLGAVGNQVMYNDIEHLNALVDEYLGNPHLRWDVTRYLQHQVCTQFSFRALCERILADEPFWRN